VSLRSILPHTSKSQALLSDASFSVPSSPCPTVLVVCSTYICVRETRGWTNRSGGSRVVACGRVGPLFDLPVSTAASKIASFDRLYLVSRFAPGKGLPSSSITHPAHPGSVVLSRLTDSPYSVSYLADSHLANLPTYFLRPELNFHGRFTR
jgi:hypothetical protein